MALDIDLKLICRCCMGQEGPMKSLFNMEIIQGTAFILGELYASCTSIQVNRDDGLPTQLCSQCSNCLKKCYSDFMSFRDTALKTDKTLREELSLTQQETKPVSILQRLLKKDEKNGVKNPIVKLSFDNKETLNPINECKQKGDFTIITGEETNIVATWDHTYTKSSSSRTSPAMVNISTISPSEEKPPDTSFINLSDTPQTPSKNYYHCGRCTEVFSDYAEYENHVAAHGVLHKYERYKKTFETQTEFSEHMFYHTLQTPETEAEPDNNKIENKSRRKRIIKCNLCDKRCMSVHHIKMHMRVHMRERRPYMCHICGKRFVQRPHLKKHFHCHKDIVDINEKKHTCVQCSKTFHLPCELRDHLRIHTGERPFQCPICAKSFRLKVILTNHLRLHEANGQTPEDQSKPQNEFHSCNFCSETFPKKLLLEDHILIQHPSETFNCHFCQRVFSTKNALKSHVIKHLSNQAFTCQLCNRSFKDKTALDTHLKHHENPKPFQCDVCHKDFNDRFALRRHFRSHTGEPPFVCELCNRRFSAKKSLVAHTKIHMGEKLYVCFICKSVFAQQSVLLSHMVTMHRDQALISSS